MTGKYIKEGTGMKGKDLKGVILCRILSGDMEEKEFKEGTDADTKAFALEGSCGELLHFTLIRDICRYLKYGTRLAVVSIPDDETVYMDRDGFCTHKMHIQKIMMLDHPAAWEYLAVNGADLMAEDCAAFRWAALNGYLSVMEYLYESGAYEDRAVIWAVMGGRLEAVKYLYGKGADIKVCSDFAVRYAAEYGYSDMVEYLHKNGADITACDHYALRMAAENGHADIVEYLKANR